MNPKGLHKTIYQVFLCGMVIVVSSFIMYLLKPKIDYPIVALVLLFMVSIFAVTLDILPVIFASAISALILNYFFIPPLYTFHIASANDVLLFLIFFIVSIVNAILTHRIRKVQEQARDKAEKEKTIELYNTLLNSLSHELRTPLATITASVDTLNYRPNNLNDEQQNILLNQIQIASEKLNKEVDNLLNMSRLESGTLQVKPNWCDINEVIESIVFNLMENHSKSITYEIKLLPLVFVDEGLLNQILSNLIGNALVHTHENATVFIKANIELEKELKINIIDTGFGLPQEELSKIFDKFYRAPTSNKGGTGLGLSIVKGYLTALNGSIDVKNNIPRGLIFEVKIPVQVSYLNNLKNE